MQDVSVTVSPSIQEPEPFATVQLSSHTYLFIGMYIALFPLTVLLGLPRYTIFNKAYPFLQRSTVRPWIHHLPYKINIFYCFALQPSPPRWNFPTGATGAGGVEAGAGGSGSAGKVSAELLTTHSTHCSKTLISATAPQVPPLEIIIH